jgi:DNA polymerase-3 subunit alpha
VLLEEETRLALGNTLRFSLSALALATVLGLTHAVAARHSVGLRASAFLPFVVSPVTVAFGLLLLYPQWTASLSLLLAAYALLAYHTAWIKVHYTAEFFCGNMTVEMDNTDKLKVLHEDALKMGLTFEPPDVNRGGYRFEPVTDKVIRYGLGAIKGSGQAAIEAIIAARNGQGPGPQGHVQGPFKSLWDFCTRVDRAKLNKRTLEALIKAGAFDSIERNRAALMAATDAAFEFANAQWANAHQGGLFDMMGDDAQGASSQAPELPQTLPWGIKERLMQEKTAVGFYLSGHLFDEVESEVRQFIRTPLADLAAKAASQTS